MCGDCRKTKATFIDGIISKESAALFERNYTIGESLRPFSTVSRAMWNSGSRAPFHISSSFRQWKTFGAWIVLRVDMSNSDGWPVLHLYGSRIQAYQRSSDQELNIDYAQLTHRFRITPKGSVTTTSTPPAEKMQKGSLVSALP